LSGVSHFPLTFLGTATFAASLFRKKCPGGQEHIEFNTQKGLVVSGHISAAYANDSTHAEPQRIFVI